MLVFLNILPVILFALGIFYQSRVARFAHSVLGKFIAIGLILAYSSIHVLYGIFVCALVILYYQSDYVEGFDPAIHPVTDDAKSAFRSANCKNGQLMHKTIPVKTEMITHVYPEIEFPFQNCNPCAATCDFSFMEEKMKTEENIQLPKNSNDWVQDAWSKVTTLQNPIPSLWVKSEPFAAFSR